MNNKGVTLIEAVIGFAGLGIFLLMVYTLLMGGIKNWMTINPQLTARQVSREILNGKTGDEWGGLVGEIKACNIRIGTTTPTGATTTSLTALNLQTNYATGSLVGTVAICYAWQGGTPTYYPLDKSVSQIGTLTKTVWLQQIIGTVTTWKLISTKTLTLANNIRIRMGSATFNGTTTYPLFRYYTGLGVEIFDDPATPQNELLQAIQNNTIRQIGINMVFDIDTDNDGKFGEDPNGDQDGDGKIDKPADFSINTKVATMNLDW